MLTAGETTAITAPEARKLPTRDGALVPLTAVADVRTLSTVT